jgi:Ca2+:H+ antiporter
LSVLPCKPGILALKEGLIVVVQSSLVGSVLSNLLLVLGFCYLTLGSLSSNTRFCFFLGGLKFQTQKFNVQASGAAASLFILSLFGFLLPAVFTQETHDDAEHPSEKALSLSRGTAILLMISYIGYLIFQLVTHKDYFSESEEEEEAPLLTMPIAVATLLGSTVLIGICAEYLVSSLEGISLMWGLSETFIGIIVPQTNTDTACCWKRGGTRNCSLYIHLKQTPVSVEKWIWLLESVSVHPCKSQCL